MKLGEVFEIEEAKRAANAPTPEQMATILEAHKSENPELETVTDREDEEEDGDED